jgi:hypothetical protein
MNTTNTQGRLMGGTASPADPASAAPTIEPLAVRLADAIALSGFSRSGLYRMASRGELIFLKSGDRVLVDFRSLKAAVDALPRATINVAA